MLKMDRSGLLYCRDEGSGLDSTTLSDGNAKMAERGIRTPPRRGGKACITDPFAEDQHLCDLDTDAPEDTSFLPPDDSVDVALSLMQIVITFDKVMARGVGNIEVYESGVLHETIDVTDATKVLLALNVVTIILSVPLNSSQSYHVLVDDTALVDCNNTAWPGISSDTTWTWTTADDDNPLLISSTPLDNAIDVCYNDDLQLVFNETVQANVGTIFLKRDSDDVTVDSWDVTVDAVFTGNIVDLPLSGNLASNVKYYLEIAAGVIEDISSNPYAGLSKGDLDFTSVDTTPITFTSPGEHSQAVPSWATSVQVKFRPGGGGGGGGSKDFGAAGGGAVFVDVTLDVSAITTLAFHVGGAGLGSAAGSNDAGGGGGAGGGYTGVFNGTVAFANRLALGSAGGGGGGGDTSAGGPGKAGAPGSSLNGTQGASSEDADGGHGGTSAAGGAGGAGEWLSGSPGGALFGGDGADGHNDPGETDATAGGVAGLGGGGDGGDGRDRSGGAGGGGSGYYGGGGGGTPQGGNDDGGAGGGSGSTFLSGFLTNAVNAILDQRGNPTDPDLGNSGQGGVGGGADSPGDPGVDGMIWVQFGCEVPP